MHVSAGWVRLCMVAALVAALLWNTIAEMFSEEIKTRLSLLPYAALRLAALRVPRRTRQDVLGEWRAELDFILSDTDGLPLTRLIRGLHYSASLLRLLVPVRALGQLIAKYLKPGRRPGVSRDAAKVLAGEADTRVWVKRHLRNAMTLDAAVALAAGLIALRGRFDVHGHAPAAYIVLTISLPLIWVSTLALAGAYEPRFIGAGADEFRRIINAGLGLTSAIAILSYATRAQVSRSYVLIAMPCAVGIDLVARYALRKRLHRRRDSGSHLRRAVAVGHPQAVADLINELRRKPHHGLTVVAVCLAGHVQSWPVVAGIPVLGGLKDVVAAAFEADADTVAVLPCPELHGVRLRQLAWELEKTDTDLCLAPALLDVAGPRTSVRAAAGLPLLYVDHPDLSGLRQVIKGLFDKVAAASALLLLAPVLLAIAVMIRLEDGGPALFKQVRVGKDGRPFRLYTFRTMTAKQQAAQVTRTGAALRRWSLDELPQLINVLLGQMSLVGPRPALPLEAAKYGDYVRRRLTVRPGLTGLWQILGRSDMSWDEAVRLDLRYVENWSLAFDLLILWKTWPAVARGHGAY
jgi:exopolysaccharide biosynthesis polyprenyl glycosylphosphotransferase